MTFVNIATNRLVLGKTRVPPQLAVRSKRNPVWAALGALGIMAVGAVLFWFDPGQHQFYPFCFFHALTGLQCPGCGGTRALHQLLHGNMVAALHLNALLALSLPLLAWLVVRVVVRRVKDRPAAWTISSPWLWTFLAVAAVFAVVRNLPGFAWLAP